MPAAPHPRKLTPAQGVALQRLVDLETATVRALGDGDALRVLDHHDAVLADLRGMLRRLRLRAVIA